MSGRASLLAASLAAVIAALVVGVTPAASHAYSSPRLYSTPAHEGGGAGRYFTGSRLDGLSCDACHGGGEPLVHVVRGLPEFGWAPGTAYTLDIEWSPAVEHAAVVAEVSDASGLAVGELSLPPDELLTDAERCASGTRAAVAFDLDSGRRVLGLGDCGAHRLRMQWRAPTSPAAGPVWLHLASVQGDGSGDAEGDGPMLELHRLDPIDPIDGASTEGCQIGASEIRPVGLGLVLMFGVGLLAYRRRRGSATTVALALGLICASGCARVQPWERDRLAQPDMVIDIGGELLVASEHAVEYREGSAGAVGGAGGGCGCN
ncbi:hypothetical protein ENSA5_63080 [Enhygromyxa salina]|uniref:DUF4266 domain-containing protein n=1 Tax=Enhygromyxa salina TaxID=215803 RepID=A0A2S9XCQ6_9BACT|nr:DUF4266 domain-containing protein [Enhygromyxa salina]PRP90637.1 hypothetical protein ENSA5_63080 [Enhygromyxa salina]